MTDLPASVHAAAFAAAAVALAAIALYLLRRKKPAEDVFSLLGKSPPAVTDAAPVDLSVPIAGDASWRKIRGHAKDAAYRHAVETVRNRYAVVGDPMLLSRTLRTTMDRWGLGFRDAMIRVAETDGLR
jgi:hypothetical protein